MHLISKPQDEPGWFRPALAVMYIVPTAVLVIAALYGIPAPFISGSVVVLGILLRQWSRTRPWKREGTSRS